MTVKENVNRTKKYIILQIPDGCEKTGTSAEANKQKYSKSKFPTITQDGSPKIKVFESSSSQIDGRECVKSILPMVRIFTCFSLAENS